MLFLKYLYIVEESEVIKMINSYIIYKHTNLINGKVYIGITCHGDNPNIRWQNGRGYTNNKKFYSDIIEYGWRNFSHEILEKNLDEMTAIQKEKDYISLYNSVENGYNNSPGGSGTSQATRQKLSQALIGIKRGQKSINKQIQTKKNMSGFSTGFDPIDAKNSKRVRCKETQDVFGSIAEAENWSNTTKIGLCCCGLREHAGRHPITKQLLSWEFVDKDTPITKRCLEKKSSKKINKILCIETNKIYNTATDAERDTNIARCNIARVCQGKRKTAGGYHWRYIEEE